MKTPRLILLSIIIIMMAEHRVEAFDLLTPTASVLPAGTKQIGLFAPLTVAWSDSIQWQTHPLLFLQMPNGKIKIAHKAFLGLNWASEHGFSWPTYLLRRVAREGTGGFISPEFSIPQMISVSNGLIVSKRFKQSHTVSLHAAYIFAMKAAKLDHRTTIDLPFIYPRLDVFYSGYQIKTGLNFCAGLSQRWAYSLSFGAFWSENRAFESSGFIAWNTKGITQVRLGYVFSYAQFPFGSQAHLLLPTLDLAWRFR